MRALGEYKDLPAEVPKLPTTRTSQKRGLSIPLVVAGCLIGLAFFVCAGSVISVVAAVFATGVEKQDEWLALGDAFMQAMADREVDRAHALFSEEARREVKRSDLAAFVDGPFFALFDGYVGLEIESWYVNYAQLRGRTVEMAGPVNYQEQYTGSYEFVLTEEADSWKILFFNVQVPPEKLNAYTAKQP